MILDYWILLGGIVLASLAVLLAVRYWRRGRSDVVGALREVAVDRLENVLVPDGMGGRIQIEQLVLTAQGILVVDIKRFEGVIFGSDRMNEWTVIGRRGRFTFPNPQSTLYDRVAAVKQLVRDVTVVGYVLFPETADFSKGRPRDVVLPKELAERHKKPDRSATERLGLAFAQHWERIREAVEPAPPAGRR
ncbi:MAG TPA: nuclease-related domain-containing protein [Gammaproteobacteria bacterium]